MFAQTGHRQCEQSVEAPDETVVTNAGTDTARWERMPRAVLCSPVPPELLATLVFGKKDTLFVCAHKLVCAGELYG